MSKILTEKDYRDARKDARAKAAVKALSDYVNAGYKPQNFCTLMTLEHRTLQAWMTDLMIDWLRQLVINDKEGMTDGRNQWEAKAAKVMTEALDNQ